MRPQNKKKETKPRKTAKITQRGAGLAPLRRLEKYKKRLLERYNILAKASEEKTTHIFEQSKQIEMWKLESEYWEKSALEKQRIIESNSKTIASIEKDAIAKIRLLKAGIILSLAVNIICIIILLYLINY